MSPADVPILSVLDLAPVVLGSNPSEALANSLELARHVEGLGYHRYWVAEHHNMPGIASSSPPVLIAHLAAGTSTLRLGSGGVMLPNHAPLVVAEQFGMLEALHPGRIDLGIGRAPGTDPVTAHALRRRAEALSADEFPQQLGELLAFFNGTFPDTHPYRNVTAVPGLGYQPALWLLGSSDYSAQVAGLLGLPFSFAHHFSAANTEPALAAYREAFQPSEVLTAPYAMVAVSVIVGEDDGHAAWLAGPSRLSMVRRRTGQPARLVSPEDAAAYSYTPMEREVLRSTVAETSSVVGGPDEVRARLLELTARTGADELMILTSTFGHKDRLRSYELLREAFPKAST
ncbi:MAG TPA: LLM class flavin-dependent oxidoreductase [Acidimicrobiales bacterium]|nr:LLM class flavin-dependent oxidoreductase [Acidimicrobiales bacterium]